MSINYKNVNKVSEDIKKDRVEELKKILPEVFTEGKIDIEKLKLSLGEDIDERPERFNFTWAGKNNAIKTVLVPSKATLKPAKDESIKFDESENLIIEGDNLEVLKLLQKTYFGKVKMIYIDPPYNTGGDFVYHDDFSAPINSYLKQTGQLDDEGNKQTSNKETNGRYHSDWLSMMYPRLKLAWNLLRDDGVIMISIGNEEMHRLRLVLDEIWGEDNFIEAIVWNKRIPKNDKGIGNIHEYILLYGKDFQQKLIFQLPKNGIEEVYEFASKLKTDNVEIKSAEKLLKNFYSEKNYDRGITLYNSLDEDFEIWGKINLSWPNGNTVGPRFDVLHPITKKPVKVPERGWRWVESTFDSYLDYDNVKVLHDGSVICGKIWFAKDENTQPSFVQYLSNVNNLLLKSVISLKSSGSMENETILGKNIFPYPKPIKLIKDFIRASTNKKDTILDFFAGSGTTAQAVIELNNEDGGNRKFVLVQLPEKTDAESEAYKAGYKTIADITKERVRRICGDTGFKVFKLSQSNYPEISFEFDPERSEEENQTLLTAYLSKAKQISLLDSSVNPVDVVYENIVKEGFSLNSKVVEGSVDGNHLFIVTDGESEMRISLDSKISPESVKKLSSVEFKGKTFVCYDNALTDSDKANISLNLELKTI